MLRELITSRLTLWEMLKAGQQVEMKGFCTDSWNHMKMQSSMVKVKIYISKEYCKIVIVKHKALLLLL